MGRFIGGIDRLRKEFGATVLVVHHTRLDGDRERGNTAFRGGTDTMISLERKTKELILMRCNKQKDAEDFEPIELKLKMVPAVDSCIVIPANNEAQILQILQQKGPLSWDQWCKLSLVSGITRASFQRRVVILRESSKILKEKGKWVVAGFTP
jgi:hypothetical protein